MVDAETIANSGIRLSLDKIRNFQVREEDVFIVTYPKSGTTWMKEIVPYILNDGNIDGIKDVPPDVRVPYLEYALSVDEDSRLRELQLQFAVPEDFSLDALESPRTMCTHLRSEFLPKGIQDKKAKVIYVARNPKDVGVSAYYFSQLLLERGMSEASRDPYGGFADFLLDFIEVKNRSQTVIYDGSKWHEHVLTWWNRRHDENVLFLKYEDMMKDIKTAVRQIAAFVGVQLTDDAVERISHHSSLDSMKKNKMALKSDYCVRSFGAKGKERSPFVRKGGAGGWKNYFTVAQNELFDKHYRDWLKDSDLEMAFEL